MRMKLLIVTLALALLATMVFLFHLFSPKYIPPLAIDPELAVGQSFIVGIRGTVLDTNDNLKFLESIKPGGVVLYGKNFESDAQFKKLISDLQTVAIRTTGRKYFVLIDEEPSGATRMNLFRNIFTEAGVDWLLVARDIGRMREVGINVDLAPLADYVFSGDSSISHRLPIKNIPELENFNQKFIQMLAENNISSTLKHFPGMGMIAGDTHKKIFYSDAPTATIKDSVDIFKSGIDSGADFVMTDHGIYKNIDGERSASISPLVIKLLREEAGFQGLIITDDITNMPVGTPLPIPVTNAALLSLQAGNNLVMFSNNRLSTENSFQYILDKYKKDNNFKNTLDENYKKLIEFKDSKGF